MRTPAGIDIPSTDLDEAVELLTADEIIVYPIRISQILLTVWCQFPNRLNKPIERLPLDNVWVKWASESVDNYELLWNFGMDIIDEHDKMFGSKVKYPFKHGSSKLMEALGIIPPLPAVGLTAKPDRKTWWVPV